MLGLSKYAILNVIRTKQLKATRIRGLWSIPRSEVVRFARDRWADRPIIMARILALHPSRGRIVAITEDRKVRELLAPHRPRYVSSLFGLGQSLCVEPSWMVLIDWDTVGSGEASDVAERLAEYPDRPLVVGLMTEGSVVPRRTKWDNLIERPGHVGRLKDLLKRCRQTSELSQC